jgi:hypothetical protein
MRFREIAFAAFGRRFLGRIPAIAGALIVSLAAAVSITEGAGDEKDHQKDVRIVVFRHSLRVSGREGMTAKEEMEARKQDEEAILKAAKDSVRYTGEYEGGASCQELFVSARDLGQWRDAINKLIKSGSLRYYEGWGLDRNGYGLVPIK